MGTCGSSNNSKESIVNGYSRPKWIPEVKLNNVKPTWLLKGSINVKGLF